jgi:hypothetical protein
VVRIDSLFGKACGYWAASRLLLSRLTPFVATMPGQYSGDFRIFLLSWDYTTTATKQINVL